MEETQNGDIDIGNINPHLKGLEQDCITLDCIQVRTKDFFGFPQGGAGDRGILEQTAVRDLFHGPPTRAEDDTEYLAICLGRSKRAPGEHLFLPLDRVEHDVHILAPTVDSAADESSHSDRLKDKGRHVIII